MREIWKEIEGYDGDYQISNHGRVKSFKQNINGKILKLNSSNTYFEIILSNRKCFKIHLLVWDHFGDKIRDGRKLQVDHIDENKTNNRIDNLQLLTNRQNTSKGKLKYNNSSQYTGVSWSNVCKKWQGLIQINGKLKYLGLFESEYEAHLAYKKALKNI